MNTSAQSRNLSMVPIQYQWARDAVRDMWSNFWTPHEQGMGEDRFQLSELTPAEFHTFKTTLAYLTTSDVQIMDNVSDGTTRLLDDEGLLDRPEIRNMLAWQAAQEALHNESYLHVLESVLSMSEGEQAEIYGLWQTEPAIREKVEMSAGFQAQMADPMEPLPSRLAALFFYYLVYEGGFFYGNFNPIFNIHHMRQAMGGTVVQLQYIRRDESLHIEIGVQLIRAIEDAAPGTLAAATPLIHDIIALAGQAEMKFVEYTLGEGILGYSVWQHMQHFHYLMTKRCAAVGISGIHPITTKTPLGWLSHYDLRSETNFFEGRVREYQVGQQLQWED